MKKVRECVPGVALLLTALWMMLALLGCQGSSQSSSNGQAPAALAYTTNPAVYFKGSAITPNLPSNSGGPVTSYRVNPALPAGLNLDTTTGIISGTPTTVTATAKYTVMATNAAGSATTALTITVNDTDTSAPTALTYATNPGIYTKGVAIAPNAPSHTGGAITSYAVNPALPAGLNLDATTGIISGTPTAAAAQAPYTITGSNAAGSTTAILTLTVNDSGPGAPTALTYATNPATYTKGVAIAPNTPSHGGGAVTSYAVNPALPEGLDLNTLTGIISGTPSAITATATYTVTASNSGGSTSTALTLTVNDAAPSALTYAHASAIYTKGMAIVVNTPSHGGGTPTSYTVAPALPTGLNLGATTGIISGTPTAIVAQASYAVTASNITGSTTTTLTITVNDAAPSGLTYTAPSAVYTKGIAIAANTPSSTGGAVVSYAVNPDLPAGLSLNPTTGIISGTPTALAPASTYTVTATNSGGSTSATLNLTVKDVAPSALTYSANPAVYTKGIAIADNVPSSAGGTIVSYSVSPALPAGLSLNPTTGVISGTPTTTAPAATYTVTATNTGGSTTAVLNITINDAAPSALTYSANPAVYTKGIAIADNVPSSAGGAIVSYSVNPPLPAGLSLNPTTGIISGTPTATAPAATYTVTATNTGGSTTAALNITINDATPTFLTYSTNPAIYTKGIAIADNTPSHSGGAIVSYSVNPALPAGLAFNTATGVISGTPTTLSAAADYTVTATNTGGSTTAIVNLTVKDVAPTVLTYGTNPAVYTKGTAIADNAPSHSGGAIVSYSMNPALPAGLAFNTSTGVISGTPTTLSAAADYTVTATNSGGSTTATVNITVKDVAPSALTYSTNPAVYTIGTANADNVPSHSGGAVVSYSVNPALPAGLSLNASNGVISGTPTALAAAADYTVTATNSGGSTTAIVNITVKDVAPSALTYSTNPSVYTIGTAITANTPSNAGGAVVSYSVNPALPAGLSLNVTTGVISGTPTAIAAAATYTVTATNTGGSTTAALNMTINDAAPTSLAYSTNPAIYTIGTTIAANTPSSTGGAVVSYSVNPALPAGLSLNTSTGIISGTPTATAPAATYTVTATNTGGNTTAALNITINDVAPSALTYSTNPAVYTKGAAIADNAPSHSGGAIVSYSVNPALPAGLSLNVSTGIISGTPTAIAVATTYTVTAINSGGSTTATVNITVNDVAPSTLAYMANPAVYTKGMAITANTPSNAGGAIVSYSVNPALPAGLSLNTTSGVISGTPTAVVAAANYTITGINGVGSTTATMNITVNDAAPSSLIYSTNPAAYTKGSVIPDNTPSNAGGAVVSYSIAPALPAGLSMNTTTGVISGTPTALRLATDYTVTATNTGGSTTATLNLTVKDVAPSALTYGTNPAVYTKGTVIANNIPSSSGGIIVSYAISPALPAGLSLDTATGVISGTPTALKAATNYTITATNSGGSTTVTLNLTVKDVPPSALLYSSNPATYTLNEEIAPNTPSSSGGAVTSYSVSPTLPSGLVLDPVSGHITGAPNTVEPQTNYTITATNSGGSTSVVLRITVNDICPTTLTYATNPAIYTKGVFITPNTPYNFGGTVISYSINPALPAGLSLDTTTGVISGKPTVLRPATTYTVTATNSGGSTSTTVTLTVNDVPPADLTYLLSVADYTKGVAITPNTATVAGGPVVSYSVTPALPSGLSLNGTTGEITGTPTVLSETTSYTVKAVNSGGSAIAIIDITVNDVAPTALTYPTNPAVYTKGTAIANNTPTHGGGPVVSYVITPGLPAGLSLNSTTGVISGTPTVPKVATDYTITATNTGGSTAATLNLTVKDLPPTALTYSTTPAVYTKGTAITANTPSNTGGAIVSYSINPTLPAGLSLDTTSGKITGTPTAIAPATDYTVTGTNSGGNTTATVNLTVKDVAPSSLSYSTSPAVYTKGTVIADNTPSNTGGAVVSYSVSPALPAGLSLDTTSGKVTGTPTALSIAANYTITATNSGGSTTAILSITVNDVPPSTLTYTANPAAYTKGTAITANTPSSSGGAVVSYAVSPALPAGLSLNTTSGVISGTPTALSVAANYTITATNTGGSTTATVSITVNDVAPSALTYTANPAVYTKGTAITDNTPSSSGGAVLSYSVSPALPGGLSLDTTSGKITGTPTAVSAAANYTITATNTGGSTTATLNVTVKDVAPSSLSYSTSPAVYTKGTVITDNTPSSSGGAVVSYSVSPALPAGLSLNNTSGVISGTPSAVSAAANYTITATNSGGSTTATLNITVNDVAPSALTYSANPATYTKGTAIAANTPSNTGGAVVSYSVNPALPAGLSLNTSTGVISGTPSALSVATNYTLTATNSGGSTTATVSIAVNDVAPSALTYSATPAVYTKGTAITDNAPSSSGGAVVSYSVSPALPAGLSLNTSTGVISGTPTALSAAANHTITATNSGGSTTATLSITVNDVAPSALSYTANPAVYTKGTVIADNTPSNTGGAIVSYSVSPALPAGLSLDTTSGKITGTPTALSVAANYTITATNSGGSTSVALNITVKDVAPSSLSYSTSPAVYIKGTAIAANTPSSSGGAVVSYSVSPALPAGLSLNTTTGILSGTPTALGAATDYTITATNTGGSTSVALNITVKDVAPSSLSYSTSPAVYTKGTAITANSPSSSGGAVVSYSVSPALPVGLSLNSSTGVISGTPSAVSAAANYTITATNSGGSTTATVNITVNDVAPSALTYSANPATYTKGTAIAANTPSNAGGAVVSYSVSPALPAGLSLDTTSGKITGTPTALSVAANYTITATNSGGSTTATVSITVNDVAPSSLTYTANPAVYTKGTAISDNTPSGSGGPVVSYSVSPALPAGLSLDTTSGKITGTPTAVSAAANYTITATNTGGSTSVALNITVKDVAPTSLSYSTSPAVYTKGTAIAANTPSSSGGAVVSYSVSPALPAGLSLNSSTGVISGTPAALSVAANYTITATNTGGSTTATVNLTVNDAAPTALTYSANPATYTKGTALTANTPSNTGGAIVSYSVSPALPAGLSLDTTSGKITGTPTALSAAANYTITGTNTGGSTTATVSITVNDAAPSSLTYTANPAVYTKGTAITTNTPSNGGGAVVSYSVSPALPAGLSLDTTTGKITGTPTALSAAANYTITATNTGGSTSVALNITVKDVAPSSLSYSTSPAVYTKGTAITANTPSSSGGAVVSYSVSPALPAGLSLNTSTGVISGTPSAVAAATNYTITATNTGGSTSVVLNLTVIDVPPSNLSYSTPVATYTKNLAIVTNTPTVSGGAVTSYTVSPALPTGLALSATNGKITGTPTAYAASANYTVTASNTGGSTSAILNITVNPSPLVISTQPADATAAVGATPTLSVVATGEGALTYQWRKNAADISGATSASYTLPALTRADDLAKFSVVITDAANQTVTSNDATLTLSFKGIFTATGALTVGRADHTSTLLPNGLVLIAGGRDASSSLTSAELFDPATGLCTPTGSLGYPRAFHTATLLSNGKVLIAGGSDASAYATAELYDPATGQFTATAGIMSTARAKHTATLLGNGKVLLASGSPSNMVSADLYDPATGQFTATGNLNQGRLRATATLLGNGKVFLAAGTDASSVPLASAELYDPSTGTFALTGSLGTAREQHTATLLPTGKVLVMGGLNATPAAISSAELYDPSMGQFAASTGTADVRAGHKATLLPNGTVLLTGGSAGQPLAPLYTAQLYDPATDQFADMRYMVASRSFHTATLLPNNTVLLAGGQGDSNAFLASCEIYNPQDPSPGVFSATASMSAVRQLHTITLLSNGKAFMAGGNTGSTSATAASDFYDFKTGLRAIAGNMLTARYTHSATLLPNGKVLIAGGYGGSGSYLKSAELYDPATGQFAATGNMINARNNFSSILLPNGKVLIAGGWGTVTNYLNAAELYDPANGQFTATGSMASKRCFATATVLPNGKILIAGGTDGTTWFATGELYDPATGVFSAVSNSMSSGRNEHTATLLPNGKVLIVGGWYGSTSYSASADLYDPATNSFTPAAFMSVQRCQHSATLLPSGKVLIAGGNNTATLQSAEIYDPATNLFTSAGNMVSFRKNHRSVLLPNGKVLLTGGANGSTSQLTCELYQ